MKGKKILLTVALAILILGIAGAGTVYAATEIAKSNAIGEENARNFAFVDAGISPEEAEGVEVEFEYSKGRFVYEVEFIARGNRFDYVIDSKNGKVLGKEHEGIADGAGMPAVEETGDEKILGLDRAKEIAVKASGRDMADVTFIEQELTREDGIRVYKIKFQADGNEYEYEIHSVSGKILEEEVEPVSKNEGKEPSSSGKNENHEQSSKVSSEDVPVKDNNGNKGEDRKEESSKETMISLEKAKEIALKKAGLSSKDVRFTKAKVENENGKKVYEIEFNEGGKKEYEVEIDAYSGKILDYDVDTVDAVDYDDADDHDDPDDDIDDDRDDLYDRDDD